MSCRIFAETRFCFPFISSKQISELKRVKFPKSKNKVSLFLFWLPHTKSHRFICNALDIMITNICCQHHWILEGNNTIIET